MIAAIAFLFCIFLGRFFYIQVIWEDELHYLALDQWTREIPVNAGRGQIVDRNGELLAGNRPQFSVYARASAVDDAEGSAHALADAVLGAMLRAPRAQAARLIAAGRVSVNHLPLQSAHERVFAQDIFTVQGQGRYRLQAIGGKSKKDRIFITYYQY